MLSPGDVLGGYRIDAVVGRGGMGVVYRAVNLALEQVEALKVIAPELAADEEFRGRFRREAQIAASLRGHPNVITVYNAGEQDGYLFLAMELIHGTDLRSLLDHEHRLPPHRALGLLEQIAAALGAAHAIGLVHRDVKPANVLLTVRDGCDHVYLTDFGLTKRRDSRTGRTKTGVVLGTVDYMAPEQVSGDDPDARTDVYALGCVLFEMLTGAVPYRRDTDVAVMYAHLNDPAPSALELRRELPDAIDAVIAKAMAKRPDDRFASARELAKAATSALEGEPVALTQAGATAATIGRVSRPSRRLRGRRFVAGALALLAVLVAGALALILPSGGASSAPALVGSPVALSRNTSALIIGSGSLWVTDATDKSVTRLDQASGRLQSTIKLPADSDPIGLATGGGRVWVDANSQRALIIDPRTNRFTSVAVPPVRVPRDRSKFRPHRFSFGAGAMWILSQDAGEVTRVDPANGRPQPRLRVGTQAVDVTAAGGSLYVLYDNGTVSELIADTGAFVRSLGLRAGLGMTPLSLRLRNGQLYLTEKTSTGDVKLLRYDVESGVSGAPLELGPGAEGGVFHGEQLLVAYSTSRTFVRIDGATGKVIAQPLALPTTPYSLDASGDDAWILAGIVDGRPVALHVRI